MDLKVTVDMSEAMAGLADLQKRQIPFAVAKTLTECAKAGQQAVQGGLNGKFTLRNNFTRQGVRIKPAEKNGAVIEADVHTYTETPTHPDYMEPQEDGADKVPWGGHHYIAVPTKYLQQIGGRIPGPDLRIGTIMQHIGDVYENDRAIRGLKHSRQTGHAMVFFVQDFQGHKYVFGRYYKMRQAMPLYMLIREAVIKPRLEMGLTVKEAVEVAFFDKWEKNWEKIMARGLRITM
jgi:hypothetical protein